VSPTEQIVAYHRVRAPTTPAEHLAIAALLGLELDACRDQGELTLREQIRAFWQERARATAAAAPAPAQWGTPRGRSRRRSGWGALLVGPPA
jgi:hypothetical protein